MTIIVRETKREWIEWDQLGLEVDKDSASLIHQMNSFWFLSHPLW